MEIKNGDSKVAGGVEITAFVWEKGNQKRIYFKDNAAQGGKSCYDMNKKEFVKVHMRFGPRFEKKIAEAFGLS